MQPYFLPYIGYWQLMQNVDIFVVYDDIQYTKKGWINRNRFLSNGQSAIFSLPLKKDSDFLDIRERKFSNTFALEKRKVMLRLEAAYRHAPHFLDGKSILENIFACDKDNLFLFIFHSMEHLRARLGISNRIIVSSTLGIPRDLKGQARVLATCQALGATDYINPIGGTDLYNEPAFLTKGIRLHFHRVRSFTYRQYQNPFVPNLSILDNVMFLGIEGVTHLLTSMDLISPHRS